MMHALGKLCWRASAHTWHQAFAHLAHLGMLYSGLHDLCCMHVQTEFSVALSKAVINLIHSGALT